MQKRFDTILNTRGEPVEGATVRVNQYPGGTLATIYSDDGVTQKANPMTTDANGYFEYYTANAHYSWVITTNTNAKTINDILHDDTLNRAQQFVVATGTGDAMVVSAFSGSYTIADGDEIRVRCPGENTVTNPTINLPSVGVLTIYKLGGQPLHKKEGGNAGSGNFFGAGHEITLRYRANPARMEMVGVL